MLQRKGFIRVTYQEFKKFIEEEAVDRCQGEVFHSNYYKDKNGDKIAYIETSSWGAPDIYEIKADPTEFIDNNNLQVINLISQLINKN
jgi:hypothetical protein